MTEKELIQQLKLGSHEALKAIMDSYQHYVFSIARQMAKNKELAEEITQDVFVRVFQKINSYEERSKFSTWLFTIVYRIALNYRSKKQMMITASDMATAHPQEPTGNAVEFADHEADQNFEYEKSQNEIIWYAIDRINYVQGLIISLFYLQQFSITEISEIMQIPSNTVKTQLFRGRNNIRKILLEHYSLEDLI